MDRKIEKGAISILGEYLNLAGASAAAIGFVSVVGELVNPNIEDIQFTRRNALSMERKTKSGWHTLMPRTLYIEDRR